MALRNPYQVQEMDKDLLTLSERMGLDYQAVKNLNPSITSISTGQFINLPPTTPTTGTITPAGANSFTGAAGFLANTNMQPGYDFTPPTPSPSNPAALYPEYVPYSQQGRPLVLPGPRTRPTLGGGANPLNPMNSDYMDPKNEARVYVLQNQMLNAKSWAELPEQVTSADASHAGFSPEKMKQAGYTLSNGYWVKGKTAPTGGGPTTDNNWQTNDALHLITMNKDAKNRRNRFVTNLKWAKNAWKRQKQRAKGHFRTEPGVVDIRGDTPSTTLDLILGS